jgi:hypothetical protein
MSSKPKTSNHIEVSQPSSEVGKDRREVENLASEREIERRAYEIYLERGEQLGRDLDDWLQAERELSINALHSSHESD